MAGMSDHIIRNIEHLDCFATEQNILFYMPYCKRYFAIYPFFLPVFTKGDNNYDFLFLQWKMMNPSKVGSTLRGKNLLL